MQTLAEFRGLFAKADETKLEVMSGLIEEAYDCKQELVELKEKIRELKEGGARFVIIAKREKLLIQKRASYTNMMTRLSKELCAVEGLDDNEDMGEYE